MSIAPEKGGIRVWENAGAVWRIRRTDGRPGDRSPSPRVVPSYAMKSRCRRRRTGRRGGRRDHPLEAAQVREIHTTVKENDMTIDSSTGSIMKGALAGAAGVWVMDRVTWFLYRKEGQAERDQEDEARVFDLDVAHALVRRVAKLTGSDHGQEQPNAAGLVVHYGLGVAPGALYAKLRRSQPWLGAGAGFLYGLALWAINDEVMTRVLGIAGPADEYPWQAHARGVAGHVALGMGTDVVLNVLDRA